MWTHADVADIPPIPFRHRAQGARAAYRRPVLAKDVVRYVGEPVAIVFADNAYLAETLADLIGISIEPMEQRCSRPSKQAPTSMN